MIRSIFISMVFLTGFLAGCSSSERMASNTHRSNLGTATETDILRTVPRIFDRYNFTVYREEATMDGIYFESEWKERDLFDDEVSQGIIDARSRIIVSSRPRTAQASSLQRVTLEIENQVKFEGDEEWDRSVITDQTEEYFSDIERVMRTEFSTGIRRL